MIVGDRLPLFHRASQRMGVARASLPAFGESRNLHPALRRIFLSPRKADPIVCKIYSRHQHHVSAARRQYEDAHRRFSSIRFHRRDTLRWSLCGCGLYFQRRAASHHTGLALGRFRRRGHFQTRLIAYAIYRIWIYRKYRLLDVIPRVPAEELAKRLAADTARNMLIADVRSHGYYDADSERIAGSIRIEPNNLWKR